MSSDLVKAKFVIPIVLTGNQSILLQSFNTFLFVPPTAWQRHQGPTCSPLKLVKDFSHSLYIVSF